MRQIINKYIFGIIAFFVFIIYYLTIAPTVVTLDNGELAATSYHLGIPHPPGYPLFTLLGYLFSHLPLGMRVIEKLNLLSSIYAALSVYLLFLINEKLLKYLEKSLCNSLIFRTKSPSFRISIKIFSIVGGLVFAFSKTFWFQATNYEVYSFQIFLLLGFIHFFISVIVDENSTDKLNLKFNFIFAAIFFAGVLSNHPTGAIFLIPMFLILFSKNQKQKNFYRAFIFLLIALIVTMIFYSYIPIRASKSALAGFGLPQSLIETYEHITAKVYSSFFFSSSSKFFENLNFFFSTLWFSFDINEFYRAEFGLNLIFLPIGMLLLFFVHRKFFWLLTLTLIVYIILPSSYNIYDIDALFIYAYLVLSFLITSGIFFTYNLIQKKIYNLIFLSTLILTICLQIYFNGVRVNQKGNYVFENYFKKIVGSAEPNSIALNYSSYFHSMSLYFQFVEKFRPDVIVILYPLVSEKWYSNQIHKWYELKENIIEINEGNVKLNTQARPSYITSEMLQKISSGSVKFDDDKELAPYGLCFRLTSKGNYVEQTNDLYEIGEIRKSDYFSQDLREVVFQMILNRIYYELDYGYNQKAKELIELIKRKFPNKELPAYLIQLE
ncbi:MAG: DUF2723 domain-containing protein [Ignavibacteria bacterium]|nr:DUF2723 domain-containing protein [Ignavibacteria bacterium]